MKTVKSGGEIRRVEDAVAEDMVKRGWAFCSKSEWKTKVRATAKPVIQPNPEDNVVVPVDKISKKQERKNKKLVEKLVGSEPKKKGKKEKTA